MVSSFTCSAFKCWSRSQRIGTVLGIIIITFLIAAVIWLGFFRGSRTRSRGLSRDEEGASWVKRKEVVDLLLEWFRILGKGETEKKEISSRRQGGTKRKTRPRSRSRSTSLSSLGQGYRSSRRCSAEPPMMLSSGTPLSGPSPAVIRTRSLGHIYKTQDAGFGSHEPSWRQEHTRKSKLRRDTYNGHLESYWSGEENRGRTRARPPPPWYDSTRFSTPIYCRPAAQPRPSLSQPRVPARRFHDAEETATNVAAHILRRKEQRRQVTQRRRKTYHTHSPVAYTDESSPMRIRRVRARSYSPLPRHEHIYQVNSRSNPAALLRWIALLPVPLTIEKVSEPKDVNPIAKNFDDRRGKDAKKPGKSSIEPEVIQPRTNSPRMKRIIPSYRSPSFTPKQSQVIRRRQTRQKRMSKQPKKPKDILGTDGAKDTGDATDQSQSESEFGSSSANSTRSVPLQQNMADLPMPMRTSLVKSTFMSIPILRKDVVYIQPNISMLRSTALALSTIATTNAVDPDEAAKKPENGNQKRHVTFRSRVSLVRVGSSESVVSHPQLKGSVQNTPISQNQQQTKIEGEIVPNPACFPASRSNLGG